MPVHGTAHGGSAVTTTGVYFNVKDYGAVGDGATNDTPAIRATIAAAAAVGGGTVYFPNATYLIAEYSTSFQCLSITSSNITLLGQSRAAIVKLAATQRSSVRMVYAGPNISNFTIQTLKLDGNRPNQTDQTGLNHNDAVFLDRCTGVRLVDVEIAQPAASSVVIYTNTTDVGMEHCYLHDGGWMGVAMGDPGGQARITINDCRLHGLGGGFHIEVSQANSAIRLVNSSLETSTGSYALQIAGNNVGGPTTWSDNVVVDGCTVTGGVLIGEAHGCRLSKTNITCADTSGVPALKITGQGSDILVSGCRIVLATGATATHAVWVAGDSNNQMGDVYLLDNDIYIQTTTADAVMVQQCDSLTIRGGSLTGNASISAGYYGVNIDSLAAPNQGIIRVLDATITDFQYGVVAQALGTVTVADVQVRGCTFRNLSSVMSGALSLDLDARHSVQAATVTDCELVGLTTLFSTYPTVPVVVSGTRGGVCDWSGSGAPGALASVTGSTYRRRDGGSGTSIYVNESAGGSGTTWTAK